LPAAAPPPHASRLRLLDAALHVIRAKGYSATRVEDVCEAAGLTKGGFFHHFDGKEALALAAADHFAAQADALFAAAPYRHAEDPLDRLLGYVDLRIALLRGELPEFTCLLGTMVQEVYDTHPALRAACDAHLGAHTAMLAREVAAAKRRHAPHAPWSAEGFAAYMQAVVQGAFVLAKARQGPQVAIESLRHLRRHVETQFPRTSQEPTCPPRPPARRSSPSSGSTPRPRRR
jgi:TetR/AcrR family transcriptional repressor of nem operon